MSIQIPTISQGLPSVANESSDLGITLPPNDNSMQSMLDATFIENTLPQGFVPSGYEKSVIDAYNTSLQPNEIGPQGMGALYPGLGENINVGTYSGSVIGNNPIFVPTGNILPIDPILARKKAIDDAAKKRALAMMDNKPLPPDLKKFKDSRFDEKLNNDLLAFHNQFVKDAYDMYGPVYGKMLKDPNTELGRKYIQGMANFDHIVRNVDRITDLVTQIDAGLKDGSIAVTPEGMKQYEKYKQMLGDFTDYEKLTSADMNAIETNLIGIQDINNYLNDEKLMGTIKAKVTSTFGTADKGMYYNSVTNKKTSYKDVIEDVTNSLANSTTFKYGIENGFYTKEDIKAALDARLKDQQEISGSMNQKSEWAFDFGRGIDVPDPNEANAFITYTNKDGQRGVVQVGDKKYESLADYNMTAQGTDRDILVLGKDGKPSNVKIKGVALNDIQVANGGKMDVKGGRSIVQLGEMTLLNDGRLVQKSVVYRPEKVEVKGEGGKKTVEVWVANDELVVLQNSNGKGTSAKSEISTQIKRDNTKAGENYDKAVTKMENVRKKGTGGSSTAMYEYQGESYTYDELIGAGWKDEQIKSLKKK